MVVAETGIDPDVLNTWGLKKLFKVHSMIQMKMDYQAAMSEYLKSKIGNN